MNPSAVPIGVWFTVIAVAGLVGKFAPREGVREVARVFAIGQAACAVIIFALTGFMLVVSG
jgi:hypothetical protein